MAIITGYEHLPRERIVVPGTAACTCCGNGRPSWAKM